MTTELTEKERTELQLQVWERAVETQMHFNEMSVKSRQFGLAFVAAALGIGIVLLSQGKSFTIVAFGWQFHIAGIIVFGAAMGLRAVRLLDLNVYHKMLRGAVCFGEDIEEQFLKKTVIPLDKGMTQAISHFSRFSDATVEKDSATNKLRYRGSNKTTAEDKIREFYNFAFWTLIVGATLLLLTSIEKAP